MFKFGNGDRFERIIYEGYLSYFVFWRCEVVTRFCGALYVCKKGFWCLVQWQQKVLLQGLQEQLQSGLPQDILLLLDSYDIGFLRCIGYSTFEKKTFLCASHVYTSLVSKIGTPASTSSERSLVTNPSKYGLRLSSLNLRCTFSSYINISDSICLGGTTSCLVDGCSDFF